MSREPEAGIRQRPNWDTAAAREYHAATNHSLESVRADVRGLDWANQPRPYKLYSGLPALSLPAALETRVPALAALTTIEVPRDRPRIPTLAQLASLLHYSAGITRTLRFTGGSMEFRAAACTGALYHIELYLICGDLPGIAAGVYQFGAHDGALRQLRAGDYRDALIDATAGEPSTSDAPAIVAYTTTFWRNSWKYQSRAYRHAFWDCGTILANSLALATAHGLQAKVVTGFVDGGVNRLLALDDAREVAIALVPLGWDPEHRATRASPVETVDLDTIPLSHHEIDYPPIRRMHRASSLADALEVSAFRNAPPLPASVPPSEPPAAPNLMLRAELLGAPLEAVIRSRGSSRRFAEVPISSEALITMLNAAGKGIAFDGVEWASSPLSEPFAIVNRVDGMPSGAYRYDQDRQALELLRAGGFIKEAGYLDLGQALGADAAVDIYWLANLEPILNRLGNRGYRVAQLEAAIKAGRVYLASYALGLGATGLTFFDDDVIEFFSPRAQGMSVMFLLALGVPARRRPPT